jgi:hypothetical protein
MNALLINNQIGEIPWEIESKWMSNTCQLNSHKMLCLVNKWLWNELPEEVYVRFTLYKLTGADKYFLPSKKLADLAVLGLRNTGILPLCRGSFRCAALPIAEMLFVEPNISSCGELIPGANSCIIQI